QSFNRRRVARVAQPIHQGLSITRPAGMGCRPWHRNRTLDSIFLYINNDRLPPAIIEPHGEQSLPVRRPINAWAHISAFIDEKAFQWNGVAAIDRLDVDA